MISLSFVTKTFKNKVAVDKISFKTKEVEIIGFVGPNGAGKTTTIRLILGYLQPTEVKIIREAVEIGKAAGLKYVYSGNIPGDTFEDTYCPKCKEKIINRVGYLVERFDDNGKCNNCGENLSIIL